MIIYIHQMLQVCKSNEEPIFEWVWDQIDTAVSGGFFVFGLHKIEYLLKTNLIGQSDKIKIIDLPLL